MGGSRGLLVVLDDIFIGVDEGTKCLMLGLQFDDIDFKECYL